MVPAKQESITITTIEKNGLESIVDWFDQHKRSFYALGWAYLRNQKQMEELFYQSIIKVHKEMSRFKKETSFEMNVTSLFIHICREISNNTSLETFEGSEPRQELFKALDSLNKYEREALVLTYIKGFTHKEVARLLEISMEELKEKLFLGIQSLRKEMGYGSNFKGCKEYHGNYIDYLEKKLDRSKKVDFEVHIYHCENCQEDLASFQDVMIFMLDFSKRIKDFDVPSDFMENIKARLAENNRQRERKIKKRKKIAAGFASVFLLLIGIGIFTGSFTKLYYTWTEKDPELRKFLQQDLGERLNLEAENKGIKIKIKSVIADEFQTLVFYEIEDTSEDNQYWIDYGGGVSVENGSEIMNSEANVRYYPPDTKQDFNKKEKNIYQGKFSLQPLTKNKGTIKLKITQLQKMILDASNQNSLWAFDNMESKFGEWDFEIPVTKKPSKKYELQGKTKVEGIPIQFDKLTIAPTTTVLDFTVNNELRDKQIDVLNFDNLEVNNKKVKADIYGSTYVNESLKTITFQTNFEPLFGEKPKEVSIQLDSAALTIEDEKNIELDSSQKYPQTFEYAGSTISIDAVKIGRPAEVVISNSDIKKRAYESLNLSLLGEDENQETTTGMDPQRVLVDKNGIEYDKNIPPESYEKIKQLRYFDTVISLLLVDINEEEEVTPKTLVIHGYNTTKFMDDVVGLELK